MVELARALEALKERLRDNATTPQHFVAVAEVAQAEIAAREDDTAKVRDHLTKAGKWALDMAKGVGIATAAAAIKAALGL